MKIYDKNFHSVDPLTSRPFSSGHPDGVWLISIFYGLVIAVPAVGILVSVVMLFFGDLDFSQLFIALGATVGSVFLFLPPILLLFERSDKVFYIFYFYLAAFGMSTVWFYSVDEKMFYFSLALLLLQTWAAYYVFRLKQDGLIGPGKCLDRP
jgi:hypothetical protein